MCIQLLHGLLCVDFLSTNMESFHNDGILLTKINLLLFLLIYWIKRDQLHFAALDDKLLANLQIGKDRNAPLPGDLTPFSLLVLWGCTFPLRNERSCKVIHQFIGLLDSTRKLCSFMNYIFSVIKIIIKFGFDNIIFCCIHHTKLKRGQNFISSTP